MPDTASSLSVVVCTHNRPADLERCLDALVALDERPEVIVVDSASEPPCGELVENYASDIPGLVYIYEPDPGLSRARNRGVARASGSIIAFVDDDAAPRRDWSREIVAPFHDPGIGCVGGACLAAFEDGAAQPPWLSDRLLQFAGITRFGDTARPARSSAEWPFGANIAFRASVLSEDPFPENLGRHGTSLLSGEEFALVESLRDAGWKIWLEPRAIVDHTVGRERCRSQYYWRRLWWAGVTRARAADSRALGGLRLVAAAPVRLCLYLLTRDRVHLYRSAETAGFIVERLRLRRSAA
jgi:glycosyltransferase involved in cell wall biosynthesis